MKRVLSLVLAISMVMSMFTFSFAGTSLKDVEGTDYEAAVEALVELGIVNGYEDGTYRPEQNVSRAEMAKLLVVAAGLEPAAKLAEGATKFADVNGGWASGYVNVASEYGYVMGDPDGNFRPDDTVSYAEAATMALRVLGYKAVVEAKGTWPTNYIAKAEDLELLEDITYGSYNDGAARGNVAILIWNMLKTQMWEVMGESEGDGLEYYANRAMLNVKFPDYSYSNALFVDFTINGDGEVVVELDDTYDKYVGSLDLADYTYAGLDFYTFVPGTEVEVLVNEEDELLLTMVPTGADKLVEGNKVTLDEDYDALDSLTYDYAYGMVERKEIVNETILTVESSQMIVEKTEKADKYVKLNKVKYENDDYDYEVIIKDGERATINDIEVGDVLTKVNVSNGETFYMVSRDTAEGKLTKYVIKNYEGNDAAYHVLTVGGEEYLMDLAATYVEDPEDDDEKQTKSFADEKSEDMRGEVVTLIRDFLGRVVRVEFDGSIDEENTELKFFVVTEEVEKEGLGKYVIGLENKDESDTFRFAKSASLGSSLYADDQELVGALVLVEFNDEDEIKDMTLIASAGVENEAEARYPSDLLVKTSRPQGNYNYHKSPTHFVKEYEADDTTTADKDESKSLVIDYKTSVTFDDENEALVKGTEYKMNVDENVIVITLLVDDKGTDDADETDDDVYSATFEEGLAALENVNDEDVIVITDTADTFEFAKYVVRFDDNSSREENLVGIVDEARNNEIGETIITIDGTTYVLEDYTGTLRDLEGAAVLFTVETDEDGEEYATLESVLFAATAANELAADVKVTEASESAVKFDTTTETFKDSFHNAYDEYVFIRVAVDVAEGEIDVVEDPELGENIDAKFFAEDDGVYFDSTAGDVIWVVENLDWSARYDITWVVDGTSTTVEVREGTTPKYNGTPAKEGYEFTGWDAEIVPATANATYTATFVEIPVEEAPAE